MYPENLIAAGLSKHEAEVYLALLESGAVPASKLAQATKISRPHVYDALNQLIHKGLVSYFFLEKKRIFKAAEPEKLSDVLKEKEGKLQEERARIEKLIPELKKIRKKEEEELIVEVYKGIEGMKTMMEDILRENEIFPRKQRLQRTIGWTGKAPVLAPQWWEKFQKRRAKEGIRIEAIATSDKRGYFDVKRPLMRTKFLPEQYALPVSAILYGEDKLIFYAPFENDFIGIFIKSRKMRESYDSHFKLLWNLAKD